jgi:uncharacterized protein
MTREQIITALVRNHNRIRGFGVRSLAVFGSAAREELGPKSDVDLLVDIQPKSFDAFMDLKLYLEEILGRKVDLILKNSIKPALRKPILSSAVNVPGY